MKDKNFWVMLYFATYHHIPSAKELREFLYHIRQKLTQELGEE